MRDSRSTTFLNLIKKSQRGKLKIYLGYCAGVGKTYNMLLEARKLKNEGIDIAIGYIETHGRQETEALLDGLELLPRQSFIYRGIEIQDLDLTGILERKPEVVLIDELAHTNVPGSRNIKRFQDVDEILASGIHVITTLNIQHIESLYEAMEMSTGIKVRERIPDRILIDADQIVNVDVSVEDLLTRLKEGKIYVPEGIENSLNGFFKADNLEQLRELTLRELAAQIDSHRRDQIEASPQTSPDQIMVCLSSMGTNRDKLLRYASRLAGRLNRNWYALYVQTPSEKPDRINATTQRILSDTLGLAKQLGATVFTYKGEDVVETILQFAKEYRVGHIVIGTPRNKLSVWQRLTGKKGIAERLIEDGLGITIVTIDTRTQNLQTDIDNKIPIVKQQVSFSSFDILHPLRTAKILIWNNFIDKNDAIRDLVNLCCTMQKGLNADLVFSKVLNREQQGATYLSEEIGFPHCRMEGLPHPLLAIGIAKSGVLDPVTGNMARILILLLSPAEIPDLHIKMIGHIARFASDGVILKQLLESADEKEALHKLLLWDS